MCKKSLISFGGLFLLASLCFPAIAVSQEDLDLEPQARERTYLQDHQFRAGLALGGTFDPGRFMIIGRGEFALDRHFTLGPTIQLGFGSDRQVWIPTIGGRYRAPIFDLEKVEFSLHSGAGLIGRRALGRTFYDFNFAFGADLEFFVVEEVSVGLGMILNVTSSSAERTITVLHAGVTYHL